MIELCIYYTIRIYSSSFNLLFYKQRVLLFFVLANEKKNYEGETKKQLTLLLFRSDFAFDIECSLYSLRNVTVSARDGLSFYNCVFNISISNQLFSR